MAAKRISQRERALTIYFATAKEKQEFVKHAEGLGLTASFVGALCIYRAVECGVYKELDSALALDRKVLQSKPPTKRPRVKTPKS
jgi:hypothetical protein